VHEIIDKVVHHWSMPGAPVPGIAKCWHRGGATPGGGFGPPECRAHVPDRVWSCGGTKLRMASVDTGMTFRQEK